MKRTLKKLPRPFLKILVWIYEYYHYKKTKWLFFSAHNLKRMHPKNIRPRILFYHVSGLSFGGTEKFLQILAKHLDKGSYDVYFMYSAKPRGNSSDEKLDGRKNYLANSGVNLIEFDYDEIKKTYPYSIEGMRPNIFDVLRNKNIDLVVTAGSGYSEFPFNLVRHIPIILLNIFGSPTTQNNIASTICISNEVAEKIRGLVPENKIETMYIQSERPDEKLVDAGRSIRKRFGIKDGDFVFGRIGRPDDFIFDPIGIRAFQKVVKKFPDAHYIIMAPPPNLLRIVQKEKIPNVHLIAPSSNEDDIWAFHQSIDALAHFRYDGESCGLNIIESMLCGKPILTHRSHIWNAHLEYLDDSFSKVAEKDNVDQYSHHMEFFIREKEGKLKSMGESAKKKAESLFLIQHNIKRFEEIIKCIEP